MFMTGRQQLQFHAALRGIPRRYRDEEVDKWLDVLGNPNETRVRVVSCSVDSFARETPRCKELVMK